MREFLTFFGELVVVIAVAGLFYTLAPEGSQKKYIQLAISLSLLAALIGPMLSVVSDLPRILEDAEFDVEQEEDVSEGELTEAVIAESKRNIEEAVASLLMSKYDLEREALTVSVSLDASDPQNIEILSVLVNATGTTHLERQKMKAYLTEQLLEQCEIRIEE